MSKTIPEFKNLKEYLQHKHLLTDAVDVAIDEYYKMTAPVSSKIFSFGAYKGQRVMDVAKTQKGKDYCGWIIKQTWINEKKEFHPLRNEIMAILT